MLGLTRNLSIVSLQIVIFGFSYTHGKGLDLVHMNNYNTGHFAKSNGVYQDGALLVHDGNTWRGVFVAFEDQVTNYTHLFPDGAGAAVAGIAGLAPAPESGSVFSFSLF